MDQAIACCGQRLTGDTVRQLVGAVPSETLEQLLNAVARNSSEDVLRQVDQLLTEGHNPAHFARQMVRFLRNALVAKVAGDDSPLLQISDDERARVGRVAAQFSEEDLTRFLQVILRTHGDLAYKQEQRFHLELGLLKLVHAQRLLPLEQLLSDSVPLPGSAATARGGATGSGKAERTTAVGSRSSAPPRESPFEADKARKAGSTSSWDSPTAPKAEVSAPAMSSGTAAAVERAPVREDSSPEAAVRTEVMRVLEQTNSRAAILGIEVRGGELLLRLDVPENLIDMSLSEDARRAVASASAQAAGRPLKLKLAGTNGSNSAKPVAPPAPSGPGARARAAEDPVVRRMHEKFGAQIRTIIDYRDKR
jgi:DNA polymerase-3 subunit gamma/tau